MDVAECAHLSDGGEQAASVCTVKRDNIERKVRRPRRRGVQSSYKECTKNKVILIMPAPLVG